MKVNWTIKIINFLSLKRLKRKNTNFQKMSAKYIYSKGPAVKLYEEVKLTKKIN